MRLLFGFDKEVGKFVSDRIEHVGNDWGPMAAIGVIDDNNNLIAGAVYNMYYPEHQSIQISMAADSPRWANKAVIKGILDYAFDELNVNRVWTATPHKSERVIKFNQRLGFTKEAVLRDAFGRGSHSTICRLLKKDFEAKYG